MTARPTSVDPSPRARLVRRLPFALAGAALLAGAAQLPAAAAPGETSTGSTTANVGVNDSITLSGLTPSFTLNGLPSSTVEGLNAVSYRVTTNNLAGYVVTVQAASDTLDPADADNDDTIPIADLSVRPNGGGSYTALSSTSAITLRTQSTRSAAGGDAYSDDYRVSIPFVNNDVYSATLNYVATTS